MAETENRKAQDVGQDEAWVANIKKIVASEISTADRKDLLFDAYAGNTLIALGSINNAIAQGANELVQGLKTQNKQLIENEKVGADRIWNVDEQGYTVEEILGQPYVDAIKAAVAAAVAEALSAKKD